MYMALNKHSRPRDNTDHCFVFNPFPTGHNFCHLLMVAYIAYKIDPDQTAPKGAARSGFIVFASMVKSSLK